MDKYDGSQIVILEGLEAVRKRPGMYIGSTGTRGLHHLIWEILDNGIDEHLAGFCTQLGITLTRDGGVVIEDNGRGVPVDIHPTKKIPTVRVVYTILHAGGKFNNSVYKVSGGLHGVGASVVNALSKSMIVEVKKDGKIYRDEYKDGGKPGTFIPHFSMFGEGFPYQKFFINEHVFKLDFGDKGFNEFAYFFLQTDYAYHWLASNGRKAAVPGINQHNVKDIWIFSPENSKVKEFGEWVQPLFTTILKNCTQNVKLAELRDSILPKLMSGELDVSDI